MTIPMLAACTGQAKTTGSSGSTGGTKTVTFGSNASDAVPKTAMADTMAAAKAAVGTDVKINTVPHNDFQNNINNYL
ncbi:MAG TPA: carbohydrate ABC transporter substrate-binding protein, partial [Dermatophilaceae bacterium]|nr:carbohydrate ABC transporter substrate-binding protein [Dermatophilaceae bacterium]